MGLALVIAFLLVPIVEIYVIIQVGQAIGAWPTVALLVAESLLGAWIVRREGRRAWRSLRAGVGAGRMPNLELADGALVLIGGTLLLTPGFVTDVAGFFLVLPPTRPLARRLLLAWATRRALRSASGLLRPDMTRPGAPGTRPGTPGRGAIIEGRLVDEPDPPGDRGDRGR